MHHESQLIGYCGVNCTTCGDYTSSRCPGCRNSLKMNDDDCFFVRCCREHKADHCGCCPAFPCTDIKEFAQESDSHLEAFAKLHQLRKSSNSI